MPKRSGKIYHVLREQTTGRFVASTKLPGGTTIIKHPTQSYNAALGSAGKVLSQQSNQRSILKNGASSNQVIKS